MKTFPQLRAGVIGTGFIGPVHIEALRRIGVSVNAICGSQRAREVADDWHIPNVFLNHDYQGLVQSPDIDVVHITSPNQYHFEQSLAAISAGKHVVCEKPLAMNSTETLQIVKAAQASGRLFAVNYNVRFYPAVLQMRSLVASGELGQVVHVNGSYMQDWLLKNSDYNWRLLADEGGQLRAVGDIGTHWLDSISFIVGSPIDSVLADLATLYPTRLKPLGEVQTFSAEVPNETVAYRVDTEDFANILMRFAGGVRGNLSVSQVAAGRKNCIRIEIYGSKQSAWWNSEYPEQLNLGRRDSANAIAFRACTGFTDAAQFTDYPGGHVEGFCDSFKMLFRSIYQAIDSGSHVGLFADANAGHQEAKLCEAILQSHQSRQWVDVSDLSL